MEIRDHALEVLGALTLGGKLAAPAAPVTDARPGPARSLDAPGRPPGLEIRSGPATKVPPLAGMADPAQRARILHGFANHELQAVELLAWALLAFPDAPADFRRGLLATQQDEQRHLGLYVGRLAEWGAAFGDFPVSGYLWGKRDRMDTPQRFVAALCLTFENANLDHSLDFAAAARRVGDEATAAVLEQVHADERRHVRFGLSWLEAFERHGRRPLEAWRRSLVWPLRPALARGPRFHRDARASLGFDDEFLDALARAERDAGRG